MTGRALLSNPWLLVALTFVAFAPRTFAATVDLRLKDDSGRALKNGMEIEVRSGITVAREWH